MGIASRFVSPLGPAQRALGQQVARRLLRPRRLLQASPSAWQPPTLRTIARVRPWGVPTLPLALRAPELGYDEAAPPIVWRAVPLPAWLPAAAAGEDIGQPALPAAGRAPASASHLAAAGLGEPQAEGAGEQPLAGMQDALPLSIALPAQAAAPGQRPGPPQRAPGGPPVPSEPAAPGTLGQRVAAPGPVPTWAPAAPLPQTGASRPAAPRQLPLLSAAKRWFLVARRRLTTLAQPAGPAPAPGRPLPLSPPARNEPAPPRQLPGPPPAATVQATTTQQGAGPLPGVRVQPQRPGAPAEIRPASSEGSVDYTPQTWPSPLPPVPNAGPPARAPSAPASSGEERAAPEVSPARSGGLALKVWPAAPVPLPKPASAARPSELGGQSAARPLASSAGPPLPLSAPHMLRPTAAARPTLASVLAGPAIAPPAHATREGVPSAQPPEAPQAGEAPEAMPANLASASPTLAPVPARLVPPAGRGESRRALPLVRPIPASPAEPRRTPPPPLAPLEAAPEAAGRPARSVVQRATDAAPEATAAAPPPQGTGPAPPAPQAMDIDELARRVYEVLRRRLHVERERTYGRSA